jgi:Holliday junction resolvase RusA-like endonuclease
VKFSVTVYGSPAPQGSHKAYVVAGRARITNDSTNTLPWRQAVVDATRQELDKWGRDWAPMQGPLVLHARFWLPRPKSAPKTIDIRPTRKPDIDKVLRATMDALTAAGLWIDDSLVVESHEEKFYSVSADLHRIYTAGWHRPPGAQIEVTTLDG